MRRISIGPSKDQRRQSVGYGNRRTSLPSGLSVNQFLLQTKKSTNTTATQGNEHTLGNEIGSLSPKVPLPRVRRINESLNDFSSNTRSPAYLNRTGHGSPLLHSSPAANHSVPVIVNKTSVSSPRRYPTHQPQFSGIGILPNVKLNKTPRAVLSEQNSSMLGRSVTVKIAAPDVLKPPTPVFVQVKPSEQKKEEHLSNSDPCATDSVISALREKRKRTIRDEEIIPSSPCSPEHVQASKRRRQVDTEVINGETKSNTKVEVEERLVNKELGQRSSIKRQAVSNPEVDEDSDCSTKRLKSESTRRKAVGVKNSLEASFSSSKRWINKVRDYSLNTSRDSSMSRSRRSTSGDRNFASRATSRNSSNTNTPRHSITLLDDDTIMGVGGSISNTSTPVPGASGRTTPVTEEDQCDSLATTPKKKKSLMLKDGASKRRLIPSSVRVEDFSRVPRLQGQLTVDDFEKDRKAEIDRVRQMLQEVDDEHKSEKDKKKSVFSATQGAATTSVSTVTSTAVTVNTSSADANTNKVSLTTLTTLSTSVNNPIVSPLVSGSTTTNTGGISLGKSVTTVPSSLLSSTAPGITSGGLSLATSATQQATVTSTSSSGLQPSFGGKPIGQTTVTPTAVTNPTSTAAQSTASGFLLPSSSLSIAPSPINSNPAVTLSTSTNSTTPLIMPSLSAPPATTLSFKPVFGTPIQATAATTVSTTASVMTSQSQNPAAALTPSAGGGFSFGSSTTAFPAINIGLNNIVATAVTSATNARLPATTPAFPFTTSAATTASTTSSSFTFGETSGKLPARTGGGFHFGDSTVLTTTTASTAAPAPTGGKGFSGFGTAPSTQVGNAFNFAPASTTSGGFSYGTTPTTTAAYIQQNIGHPTIFAPITAALNAAGIGSGNNNFGTGIVNTSAPGGGFTFGNSTPGSTQPPSGGTGIFAGVNNINTTQASTGGFPFGSGNSNSTGQQQQSQGIFNFGQSSSQQNNSGLFSSGPTSNSNTSKVTSTSSNGGFNFGQPQSGANNNNKPSGTFGSSSTFGGSSGSNNNSTPFGSFGGSNSNNAGGFGSSTSTIPSIAVPFVLPSNTAPAFGSTTNTTKAATPFGNGSASSFGGSSVGFGNNNSNTQGDQSKPFDFSKSANNNSSFSFGASAPQTTSMPAPFGTPTPSPAPAFGSPVPSGNNNMFGSPAPNGGNMFSASQVSTAPRQRTTRVAARRRGARR